jgi:hypothetical protein
MIYHLPWYPFNAATIQEEVPAGYGVYALYSRQACVYVGTSKDLKAELMRCLKGHDNPCVGQYPPDEFQFEVVLGDERLARRDELIGELNPTCKD